MRILLAVALAMSGASRAADPAEHFERNVRPVLVARCFACHSESSGKNKGGLRLDSRAAVLAGGDSGPAAIPAMPAESLLIRAIRQAADSDPVPMPPTGDPLTAEQVRHFEQWVRDGLAYPGGATPKPDPLNHWAFRPIAARPPPPVQAGDWPRTPVDRFLLARLEAAALKPNTDAAAHVIARRLAFVLTGLPPTPEAAARFSEGYAADADAAIRAYADELLSSPHFGERWARHWMDVVRYADATGHEYDYVIDGAWRYRDYLVRAFNADLPFDRFATEHLAGDLIPPRVVEGKNESLLATAWWNLGPAATSPVDLAGDEADRLDDRLDALGKTFSGVTLGCSRCHDHKFDPIPTREYYGMFGVVAAAPAYRAWANGPALDEAADRLKALRARLDAAVGDFEPVTVPPLELDPTAEVSDFAEGLPPGWRLDGHAECVTGSSAGLRGLPPGLWTGTLSRRLPANLRSPQFVIRHDHIDLLVAGQDATVQVVVANLQLIRDPIYDGLRKPIKNTKWHWLRFDVGRWKGHRAHVEVLTGKVNPHHQILKTTDTNKSRFGLRAAVLTDGELPAAPAWLAPVAPPVPDEMRPLAEESAELENAIPKPERFLAVFDAGGRDVPVYARGDAGKPKAEPVPRKSLRVWADHQPRYAERCDRIDLAAAVCSPANPLTARVIVNRLWHHVFGAGIVPTPDNFGVLGEPPSHPELLDFLADRFVTEHGWSVKSALRELVSSRAFRTASGPAPPADPANVLLSGYPLRRLDAESVRDAILAASGNLDPTLGGPPIPIPHNLQKAGTDSGNNTPPSGPADGHRRRSLYLGVWRNIPHPFLEAFDRPTPQAPFGRRDVTVSPSQALALLNDPFVIGQAEAWGERIAAAGLSPAEAVDRMTRAAFARPATQAEQTRLAAFAAAHGWDQLALALVTAQEFTHVP